MKDKKIKQAEKALEQAEKLLHYDELWWLELAEEVMEMKSKDNGWLQ